MSRSGESNPDRFPYRTNEDGNPLCRICGCTLSGRKTSFCGRRCLRDFFMQTDWRRVRRMILERDGHICMKCGEHIDEGGPFHVDHIKPISKGGDEWDLSNLELSCPKCNLSKGAKYEEEEDEVSTDTKGI